MRFLKRHLFLFGAIGASIFLGPVVRAEVCFFEGPDGLECKEFQIGEADPKAGPGDPTGLAQYRDSCKIACDTNAACKASQNFFLQPYDKCPPSPARLKNPIDMPGGTVNIPKFLGTLVARSLAVVGALTLLVFIYGGNTWLTSAGNEEKVKSGSKTMVYAVIGLFIIFASYAILNIVIRSLTGG